MYKLRIHFVVLSHSHADSAKFVPSMKTLPYKLSLSSFQVWADIRTWHAQGVAGIISKNPNLGSIYIRFTTCLKYILIILFLYFITSLCVNLDHIPMPVKQLSLLRSVNSICITSTNIQNSRLHLPNVHSLACVMNMILCYIFKLH
jgi:hypothetical protein